METRDVRFAEARPAEASEAKLQSFVEKLRGQPYPANWPGRYDRTHAETSADWLERYGHILAMAADREKVPLQDVLMAAEDMLSGQCQGVHIERLREEHEPLADLICAMERVFRPEHKARYVHAS